MALKDLLTDLTRLLKRDVTSRVMERVMDNGKLLKQNKSHHIILTQYYVFDSSCSNKLTVKAL